MAPSSETVSWSHTPENSRFLRTLVVVSVGVIGGFALAVALGAFGLGLLLLVEGRYALGLGTLLAFGVGLARTAPHLTASSPRKRTPALRKLGRWSLAGASVGGLALLVIGSLVVPTDWFSALVVATVSLPLALASLLSSEGEIDATAGTVTDTGTTIDCSTLAGFRRWTVGGYAVYRLSYAEETATFGTPRSLVIPREADAAVRGVLESGVAADPGDPGPTRRGVRLTAVALGACFLGLAGVLSTVDPTTANPRSGVVVWYAVLASGGVGVLLVAVGIRGG
ncbi:hypothetical protein [Halorussus lipolyticus]|uniref:hypothetical protein n=1 Tax=Halorussus lipolyticus TaxID=3034024 RepID=UPI0023E7F200|nr:hypothetical protein [Halorussus sp. DT80]